MLPIILKITGGLVGIFAAWYIGKFIARWLTVLQRKWDALDYEKLRASLKEQKQVDDRADKVVRKKIDDFFSSGEPPKA